LYVSILMNRGVVGEDLTNAPGLHLRCSRHASTARTTSASRTRYVEFESRRAPPTVRGIRTADRLPAGVVQQVGEAGHLIRAAVLGMLLLPRAAVERPRVRRSSSPRDRSRAGRRREASGRCRGRRRSRQKCGRAARWRQGARPIAAQCPSPPQESVSSTPPGPTAACRRGSLAVPEATIPVSAAPATNQRLNAVPLPIPGLPVPRGECEDSVEKTPRPRGGYGPWTRCNPTAQAT